MTTKSKQSKTKTSRSWDYLRSIGVPNLPPRTSHFDPGYDLAAVENHIGQSAPLQCLDTPSEQDAAGGGD